MKSWDYDKSFGVYLRGGAGFVFSVSHQFIIPYDEISCQDAIIDLGPDLVIGNNCQEEGSCSSTYPRKLSPVKSFNYSHLTGAKVFQLDEIEAYKIIVVQSMDWDNIRRIILIINARCSRMIVN